MTAKFERTPGAIDAPPPRLGADTDSVLQEAGYTGEDIAAFRAAGVV
jgi:crotonobetainyl-CoA:carnitine CoA-transferase CaiB-like acyl-CoA transferase